MPLEVARNLKKEEPPKINIEKVREMCINDYSKEVIRGIEDKKKPKEAKGTTKKATPEPQVTPNKSQSDRNSTPRPCTETKRQTTNPIKI